MVFHLPICIAVSGRIPASIAKVAPVGRNDLAVNPQSFNPANEIVSSKIWPMVSDFNALYGCFNEMNSGLVSHGRAGAQFEGDLGEILALGTEISPYIGLREKWEFP